MLAGWAEPGQASRSQPPSAVGAASAQFHCILGGIDWVCFLVKLQTF
jgi:hypothetical protein